MESHVTLDAEPAVTETETASHAFRLEETYTKADFCGLVRAAMHRKAHWRYVLSKILLTCFGIILTACALILLPIHIFVLPFKLLTTLADLLALYVGILFLLRLNVRHLGRRLWRRCGKKGVRKQYLFFDNRFVEHLPESDHGFNYLTIQSIVEDAERFYLFMDKKNAHILQKDKLEPNDADAFRRFLQERTGKEVITF